MKLGDTQVYVCPMIIMRYVRMARKYVDDNAVLILDPV